jgi:hypothetical protein
VAVATGLIAQFSDIDLECFQGRALKLDAFLVQAVREGNDFRLAILDVEQLVLGG